jgi:hypothetical protein
MFQLTAEEVSNLKSQSVISSWGEMSDRDVVIRVGDTK